MVMTSFEDLGREVIADGRLKLLRQRLGWSLNAMAEVLYASSATYASWEKDPDVQLWRTNAEKVGKFYHSAIRQIDILKEAGIDLTDLIPLHLAAVKLGIPQELLLQRYRQGDILGEDLGPLGIWTYREDQ